MGSEEGPGKGRCNRGPAHGGPGPAPKASAFHLPSRPLPPLALCPLCPLHCRKHGQRRFLARPRTAQALSSFPPKPDGEEAHRPSLVKCSSLDQSAGSKGRVPLDHCGSCPVETVCGDAGASAKGGRGFREGGRGFRESEAGASGKARPGLPGKGGRGPLQPSPWAGWCRASWFGSSSLKRWEVSPPSLGRELFSSPHLPS